jgi:hypothetical protein
MGRPADQTGDGHDPLEDRSLPREERITRVMEYWYQDRDGAALLIAQHDNDGDREID